MVNPRSLVWRRLSPFVVTFGLVALMASIKIGIHLATGGDAPFALFYIAVIGSAIYGGRLQGLLSTALGALTAYWLFIHPQPLWGDPNSFGLRGALFLLDSLIITFLCGLARDARRRAEVAFESVDSARTSSLENLRRFNSVYDSNMIGVSICLSDGSIVDCNDYILNLLGYTRADLRAGKLNWRTLTPPEYQGKGDDAFTRLRRGDSVKPYEKEYLHRNGARIPVLICATNLDNKEALVFVLDIRQTKRTEQMLEERVIERTRELRSIADRLQQSQAFLDSVVENLPIMVFVKDAEELRFLRFNRAGEELVGLTRHELMGKNDHDFFPQSEAEFFQSQDRAVLEGREAVDIPEEPLTTKFGIRYLHTKKIPIFDNTGKPIYLLGISEDITERKANEGQKLKLLQEQAARVEAEKSAEQLRLLTDAGTALNESLELKSRLDAFAQIVISHLGDWCEIVLIDESDMKIQEVVIAHRDPNMRAWANEYRSNHTIDWSQETGLAPVIRTGKPRLETSITPEMITDAITDPKRREDVLRMGVHSAMLVPLQSYGRVIGAITICNSETPRNFNQLDFSLAQDLAKRASFAIENSRLFRQAQEASAAKSAFLANMSHEIRTPLGAMLGFAELLNDEQLNVRQKEYLSTLLRNGQQLLRIVDEVLDLAKVESDRIQIENVQFSLRQVVNEAVDSMRPLAKSKNISLSLDLRPGLPDHILSDPTRLRQILTNVLGNAVKFTMTGGVNVSVTMHARPNHPNRPILEITVNDTGIGITKDQRDRLFQAFVQADNSTTRRFGGTGLGLFLSRRLARLMGGDVVLLDSQVGQGSQFVITTTVTLKEASRPAETPVPAPTQLTPVKTESRVLIVDDSADNRTLLELYIARMGYSLDSAAGGREGVEMALKSDYSVVLMDVQMPEMDGFEAVSRLRAQNYSGPIVALTAHTMKGDRERCLRGGFDDYLGKPIDRDKLKIVLEKYTQSTPSTGASSPSLTHI